ncbi:hypothetical protein Dimus_026664 [Dionaea muscipula]
MLHLPIQSPNKPPHPKLPISNNYRTLLAPEKMEAGWSLFLLLLLLHSSLPAQSAFAVGGGSGIGVGVDVGIGVGSSGVGSSGGSSGGGVWIGGGFSSPDSPNPNPNPSSSSSLTRAYSALQAWKSAIADDPSGILASWVGSNVCNYRGVFCSDLEDYYGTGGVTTRIVSAIDLNHANLRGTLVKELSVLAEMTLLHLNSNRFTGTVPESFGGLSSLTELDLSNNQLSGAFPSVVLRIPNLIYLDLRFNSFSGKIPEDLFNKRLDAIFLNNNQFQGQVPSNLGDSPASVINLANNRFSGGLPASLAYTNTAVKEILFLNNQLTGCIPDGVGLFSDMQVFDVSYNSLMGNIPDSISCLEDIEVLNLGHNKLSGELPNLVCSLKNLLNLTVAYNFFSGFSQDCAKLFLRSVGFDFSDNCIPGKGMQRPIPECTSGGPPGDGINCPGNGIPSLPKPILCASFLDILDHQLSPGPGSPSP